MFWSTNGCQVGYTAFLCISTCDIISINVQALVRNARWADLATSGRTQHRRSCGSKTLGSQHFYIWRRRCRVDFIILFAILLIPVFIYYELSFIIFQVIAVNVASVPSIMARASPVLRSNVFTTMRAFDLSVKILCRN